MTADSQDPSGAPLLLSLKESAAFLGVSLRKLYELRAAGRVPQPVRLADRTVKYRRADLLAFVAQLEPAEPMPEPPQLAAGRRARQSQP